jgi:hypothetical protein
MDLDGEVNFPLNFLTIFGIPLIATGFARSDRAT